jgi:hypothetical protein
LISFLNSLALVSSSLYLYFPTYQAYINVNTCLVVVGRLGLTVYE